MPFLTRIFVFKKGIEFKKKLMLSFFEKWTTVLFIVLISIFLEHRGTGSFGLGSFKAVYMLFGLYGFIVGFLVLSLIEYVYRLMHVDGAWNGIRKLGRGNVLVVSITALTAGVTEEIIFRGYTISRLLFLSHSVLLSVILSLIVFSVLHLFLWKKWATVSIMLWAIIPTYLYIKTGSVYPGIIMHILNDGTAFILISRMGFAARFMKRTH